MPVFSLILPVYNNQPFLEERLRSIAAQTEGDWELIVVDGHSSDGSWETLSALAARDPRVRLFRQKPRGPYPAWNHGIAQATGEFVHIATADDTMQPEFLAKLAAVLRARPECGIAHCALDLIDTAGNPVPIPGRWEEQPVSKFYFASLLGRSHLRRAPHDGLLHVAAGTVYTSANQLLVRRSVFERAGFFRDDWGSGSDFEWGMRAGLLCDVVYVPEVLASWRRHDAQLTQDGRGIDPGAKARLMTAMIGAALDAALAKDPSLAPFLGERRRLTRPCRHQALAMERATRKASGATVLELVGLFVRQWMREPDLIGFDLAHAGQWRKPAPLYQRQWIAWTRRELARRGIPAPVLLALDDGRVS